MIQVWQRGIVGDLHCYRQNAQIAHGRHAWLVAAGDWKGAGPALAEWRQKRDLVDRAIKGYWKQTRILQKDLLWQARTRLPRI